MKQVFEALALIDFVFGVFEDLEVLHNIPQLFIVLAMSLNHSQGLHIIVKNPEYPEGCIWVEENRPNMWISPVEYRVSCIFVVFQKNLAKSKASPEKIQMI